MVHDSPIHIGETETTVEGADCHEDERHVFLPGQNKCRCAQREHTPQDFLV